MRFDSGGNVALLFKRFRFGTLNRLKPLIAQLAKREFALGMINLAVLVFELP